VRYTAPNGRTTLLTPEPAGYAAAYEVVKKADAARMAKGA
jgi:hypothetical protein